MVAGSARRPALVVTAVLGALVTCAGAGSTTRAAPFPKQLEGIWSRTVTAADLKRSGAKHIQAGLWKFDVTTGKSGTYGNVYVSRNGRNVGIGGTFVPLGAGRLYIVVGVPSGSPTPRNEWRWTLAGKLLTFTRVKDSNADRAAIFAGVWKKIGS